MPSLSPKEKGVITQFKLKAREFWGLWENLDRKRGSEAVMMPEFKQQYDDLMNRGSTIRSSVESVTGIIDKVGNAYDGAKEWLTNTFGLDGTYRPMGAIPLLIPVAAIGVSLAAMGKWVKDAYSLNRRLNAVQNLINEGTSPVMAAKIVKDAMPQNFFGEMNKTIPLLIGGGLLLVFFMRKK